MATFAADNFAGTAGAALNGRAATTGSGTWYDAANSGILARAGSTGSGPVDRVYCQLPYVGDKYASAQSAHAQLGVVPPSPDYSVSARFPVTAQPYDTGVNIFGRAAIGGQYMTSGYSVGIQKTSLSLGVVSSGSLGSISYTLADMDKVTLSMVGTLIRVLVNDVVKISVTNGVVTAKGYPGIGLSSYMYLADFKAEVDGGGLSMLV